MEKTTPPSTIEGIQRRAKAIKRGLAVKHMVALDVALAAAEKEISHG